MKKTILLLSFGLLILTGCEKEESFEQIEEQTVDSVYVLDQSNDEATWETVEITDLPTNVDFTYSTEGGSMQTDGYYSGFGGTQITWDGDHSDRGIFGSAELEMSTPGFGLHFVLATECVMVNGNEAVYGGTITEVLVSKGNPPPFNVGWHFFFKVIDNGYGNTSSTDQISNALIFLPPPASGCNAFTPDNPFWSLFGYSTMQRPSHVNVK